MIMREAASSRCAGSLPDGVRKGIAMYNQGEFYECHEVLEDAWRAEPDEIRYLYQGILQIGVAFHHLSNDNWRGANGLLERGIEKVARFGPQCLGINTGKLAVDAQACLEQLHRLGPEGISCFNWSSVPRIEVD